MLMIRRALVTLGLLSSLASVAAAQVAGIPVVNNGAPTGINIGADVGFTNADYDQGMAVGARANVGLGFFGVSGMLSYFNPKNGDGAWSPGAAATLRLIGGPLIPLRVTAQAGVGHYKLDDVNFTHVPLSLGISATIPNPAFAIKPWIAPRIDVLHASVTGENSNNDVHFGFSGGIDLSLLSGMAIRAAYDRVSADGRHPSIFSLGIGFAP
jgi:hypothetical protein